MEYTVAINVSETWLNTSDDENEDSSINYDTVILVEADDIESAEDKVIDWFARQDNSFVNHYVTINKTLPKIH